MTFKVYAALIDDINSGWVWVGGFEGEQRSIVKLHNKKNRKSVYCEALKIDKNYLKKYAEGNTSAIENELNIIILSEWYRKKLGIHSTRNEENLSISKQNHLIGRFMASIQHPQVIVRLAIYLGIISVILGVIGVYLGYKSG